ncbi:uncharacterized protein LOC125648869 [Ostrea edulis]|uniref:uncharacterized protein LOC125648869 n=1 Tax=Ostrea edulis TaxID=37623 RepID=UPI002094D4B1|nr:uncharacterized protein LOC125648869 [Ostrea edulis]
MDDTQKPDTQTDGESLENMMLKFAEKLDNDLEKIDQQSQSPSNSKSNKPSTALDMHTEVTGNGSDSLLSLMTDFAEQLDKDFVQSSPNRVQQLSIAGTNSSLASFLSKVADKMDTENKSTDSEASFKETDDVFIQNMMRDLHKGIKNSDWLKENTAEKWVSENPDLAKEYMQAAAKGLNS